MSMFHSLLSMGGTPLLLDTYTGAYFAVALNKLRSAYSGSCIRVRRSSDNAEQDIGFDGDNYLDEVTLLSFVGANSGYITTWYDQSGNGRNVVQATAGNQPRIVNSGAIETDGTRTAVRFVSASSTYIIKTPETGLDVGDLYTIGVFNAPATATQHVHFLLSTTNRWYAPLTRNTGNVYYGYEADAFSILSETADGVTRIYEMNADPGTNLEAWTNGVSQGTDTIGSGATAYICIGAVGNASSPSNGYSNAVLIWDSTKLSDRAGILSILNSYYSIY